MSISKRFQPCNTPCLHPLFVSLAINCAVLFTFRVNERTWHFKVILKKDLTCQWYTSPICIVWYSIYIYVMVECNFKPSLVIKWKVIRCIVELCCMNAYHLLLLLLCFSELSKTAYFHLQFFAPLLHARTHKQFCQIFWYKKNLQPLKSRKKPTSILVAMTFAIFFAKRTLTGLPHRFPVPEQVIPSPRPRYRVRWYQIASV